MYKYMGRPDICLHQGHAEVCGWTATGLCAGGSKAYLQVAAAHDRLQVLAEHVGALAPLLRHLELAKALLRVPETSFVLGKRICKTHEITQSQLVLSDHPIKLGSRSLLERTFAHHYFVHNFYIFCAGRIIAGLGV